MKNNIKENILIALGEVSALFMSQEIKGTEMVMPTEELIEIADRLFGEIILHSFSVGLGSTNLL